MEIRKNPIGFGECDTSDEVCGFLNKFLNNFREIEGRLSVLEGRTVSTSKPEKKSLLDKVLGKDKKGGKNG